MPNPPPRRPILVTGGTGTLGRVLVRQMLDSGLRPRILSRRARNSGDPAGVQWVTADLRSGPKVADVPAQPESGSTFLRAILRVVR